MEIAKMIRKYAAEIKGPDFKGEGAEEFWNRHKEGVSKSLDEIRYVKEVSIRGNLAYMTLNEDNILSSEVSKLGSKFPNTPVFIKAENNKIVIMVKK